MTIAALVVPDRRVAVMDITRAGVSDRTGVAAVVHTRGVAARSTGVVEAAVPAMLSRLAGVVDGVLPIRTVPSRSSQTMSVKVPPISTPMRAVLPGASTASGLLIGEPRTCGGSVGNRARREGASSHKQKMPARD